MAPFLRTDPALAQTALEPPGGDALTSDGSPEGDRAAHAWSRFGGLLAALSARVQVDVAAAVAVLCVESGGSAFGPDGRMTIRFENHIFRREWGDARFSQFFTCDANQPWKGHAYRRGPGQPWTSFHGSQPAEWQAFDFARGLDETAAMRSISMGAPQVMGFNHAGIGYDRVQGMFSGFQSDARFQVIGLFDFLGGGATDSGMLRALRARDFGRFATSYNGPGQASVYGELIARHVEAFTRLRGAPPAAPATPAVPDAAGAESATPGDAPAGAGRPERAYVVRAGDTLGAIASRYGVSVAALAAANGIANPDRIVVGQALQIPAAAAPPPPATPEEHRAPVDVPAPPPAEVGRTYTVAAGDTLGAIAARFGVPVDALVQLNGIANANLIRVGEVLRLPD